MLKIAVYIFIKTENAQAWWYSSVIPALRRLW
jgi:hypothetical protein